MNDAGAAWRGLVRLRSSIALLTIMLTAAASGCAATDAEKFDTDYTLVYLKSGPTSGTGEKEARRRMFAGHMAHMHRLADTGALLIAGPFANPVDPSWRGIMLLDVPLESEARILSATDPGVQSGEFVTEAHVLRASSLLRRCGELERAFRAKQPAVAPDPTKPPPDLRAYVMISAEDFDLASAAIARSTLRDAILWSGRFAGTPNGVIVVDAEEPERVRTALGGPESNECGRCAIDAWWSTRALEGLPGLKPRKQ